MLETLTSYSLLVLFFREKGKKKIENAQNRKISFLHFLAFFIQLIFKLWLRQIGQKMKDFLHLDRKYFQKIFGAETPLQKWKIKFVRKLKNTDNHFKALNGVFWVKNEGVAYKKTKNVKIENRLVPPPLRDFHIFFYFQILLLICCELIAKTLELKHDMLTGHSRWVSALDVRIEFHIHVFSVSVGIPKLTSEFKKMFLTPLVTGTYLSKH